MIQKNDTTELHDATPKFRYINIYLLSKIQIIFRISFLIRLKMTSGSEFRELTLYHPGIQNL